MILGPSQTAEVGLLNGREGPIQLQGICAAAFACHQEGKRSQGGHVFLMDGKGVSSESYTISTVARSTPELEYVMASDAQAEAIFVRNFCGEVGFP